MPYKLEIHWRTFVWLTIHTLLICILSVSHVSAAANSMPTAQAFDIPLPNIVFGTDASLVVAGDGSVHAAFSPAAPLRVNVYPVQYTYCAAQCNQTSNWSVMGVDNVGYDGGGVRLRLDAQGHPRLMWYTRNIGDHEGIYVYAECNQACLKPANWQKVELAKSRQYSLSDEEYFTLDPQGQPHFVFQNSDGVAYYASCERACTQATNWMATPINTPGFEPFNFELAYDNNGHPRLSFITQPRIEATFVGFATCDLNCTNAANWLVLPRLIHVGVDYDHSLTVNSQGQPRLAVYTGGYTNGPTPNDYRLLYLGCDASCTASKNWFYQLLPLPASYGEDVDLALDNQSRPHLIYYVRGGEGSIYGIGQAWCTANCATNGAIWQNEMLMTTARLDLLEPKRGCSWLYAGQHPSFVLDQTGSLQVAYDGEVICDGGSAGRLIRFAVRRQP